MDNSQVRQGQVSDKYVHISSNIFKSFSTELNVCIIKDLVFKVNTDEYFFPVWYDSDGETEARAWFHEGPKYHKELDKVHM